MRGQKLYLAILFATGFFFQNCSDVQFTQDASLLSRYGEKCTEVLETISTPVRFLFVIDQSGSNVENNNGKLATDPIKEVRAGSIQQFFDRHKDKSNFSFGMIGFSGDVARTFVNGFSSDQTVVQNAINTFKGQRDTGNTPYGAALEKTYSTISNDVVTDPETNHVVVFLSDGKPNPDISNANLEAAVKKVVGVRPGKSSLNTVFYGNLEPEAPLRLMLMAQVGGGQFLNTNSSGKSFIIENVITVPGTACE